MLFTESFYPTPSNIIELMLECESLQGKTILEPSAGKGDILDYCKDNGASSLLACEINENLKLIVKTKAELIADDFLTVESARISHVDFIIMNPPFKDADKHILHAFNVAPAGCKIIALCNLQTLENTYTETRRQLKQIIEENGNFEDIGDAFKDAERTTGVNIALIRLQKKGESYKSEFEGFFMEEEEEHETGEGIMQYNAVRDLVNRYVSAIKLFDKQIEDGVKMHSLTSLFYNGKICFECTEDNKAKTRQEFKKDMQRDGWKYIFNIMKMEKYSTRGVKEDINKFIEQQVNIPFTMKNIYRMFEIVVSTASQRMDKAILEVFDRVTEHHHDNRYNIKGWKTNSHYLVGKKFILPNMVSPAKEYSYTSDSYHSLKNAYDGIIPDFEKALCFIECEDYEALDNYRNEDRPQIEKTISRSISTSTPRNKYGEWYESHFFKYRAYKNGNMHFEFINEDIWARFNARISKIKGYPLYEAKPETAYQKRQTGKQEPQRKETPKKVLFEIQL